MCILELIKNTFVFCVVVSSVYLQLISCCKNYKQIRNNNYNEYRISVFGGRTSSTSAYDNLEEKKKGSSTLTTTQSKENKKLLGNILITKPPIKGKCLLFLKN